MELECSLSVAAMPLDDIYQVGRTTEATFESFNVCHL